jgi:prepilin-type N-terminal cleavage/methylation domain-containing protein
MGTPPTTTKGRIPLWRGSKGHTLIELLVVVALLGLAAAGGGLSVGRSVEITEARTAAQSWQAGAAAAQVRALWEGRTALLTAGSSGLSLAYEGPSSTCDRVDDLGSVGPVPTPGVARWRSVDGVSVAFSAGVAAPDSGGSLYFGDIAWGSRVVVRVESGLSRRARP